MGYLLQKFFMDMGNHIVGQYGNGHIRMNRWVDISRLIVEGCHMEGK